MNASLNKLVKSILQKDSLEDCSVDELQQLVNRYPYFSAAQVLLAKKLQGGNATLYNKQIEKASLFVQNPLWLEHLLYETGDAETIDGSAREIITEPKISNEVISEIKDQELPAENKPIAEVPVLPEKKELQQETVLTVNEMEGNGSADKKPEVVEDSSGVKIQRMDPSKMDFLFQPYHTVDYFASQGIKFKDEEQPKDKFGRQLKSFTEWLKTMKRLPVAELTSSAEPASVKKVEQLAEHSLADREVITEAMAEVWEKQGNAVKAIEIYSKLSLLEPSKSAYFAAKIEELKKTN
jgi:hypothetical protein